MKSDREMIASVMHEVDEYERRSKMLKKKTAMSIAAVICVLVCLGTAVGAVTGYFTFGGIKTPTDIRENILNAGSAEGVEEFDKRMAQSEDSFAKASLGDDREGSGFILDYSTEEEKNVTVTSGDYKFELKSVVRADKKKREMTGGSIAEGTAEFTWAVNEAWYALVELSRTDGGKLTEEEINKYYRWYVLIAGYEPVATYMCTSGYGVVEYNDEYKRYIAVEITPIMPFAETDFAIVAFEEGVELSRDTFYADKEGSLEIKDNVPAGNALMRFSVDKEHADEEAVKKFLKEHEIMKNKIKGYER